MTFTRVPMPEVKVAVIGLGYVGLPLAVAFSERFEVIGFDISCDRVLQLESGYDATNEVTASELNGASNLLFTNDESKLLDCNVYVVTVPTPITSDKKPNLEPLKLASQMVAKLLKPNDVVIYESTVYPGCTEEDCVPILEQFSGLSFNEDFFCGYSPERVNPGDKQHRVSDIVKVTSGSTDEVAEFIDKIYKEIISAGTFKAQSIRIAEAAKIIENTQRDVNIALINELSQLFASMGIDTKSVLNAASTKWNFLNFTPGLVGGHCIGVDPYYLTYKAKEIGYNPKIVLAGREINDHMSTYVSDRLLEAMSQKDINPKDAKVLVMGLTFKENCPDIRNTKVNDIVVNLKNAACDVDVFDPWVDEKAAQDEFRYSLVEEPKEGFYDAIVIAVPHLIFIESADKILSYKKQNGILFDLKHILPMAMSDMRL